MATIGLVGNCEAVTDAPCKIFGKELIQAYLNGKGRLTPEFDIVFETDMELSRLFSTAAKTWVHGIGASTQP